MDVTSRAMKNLKRLRNKANLSQVQLAEKMGTDQSTVSDWELGKHDPTVATIKKMAKILRCDITKLL